ncbi:hypothetical protein [Acidianus ambivalens]|uniref:Uncharacterized protein n=1 Tax=Acidianus ambivalens TaxID=2283 RepID=A0A650CV77_ACIAM|nr:hypothetical protein [Acidianus ambivalens]MQL55755.1 hypothetical protein [Acidianus ambivalens]QGR21673.1 hypothetical protein D1866_06430 [Acidianus ambivalens]
MSIFKLLHISILGIILLSILGISFSVGSISVGNGPSYGVYSNGRIFIISQQANELQEISDASSSVSYFASPIPSIVSHKYHSSNFYKIYEILSLAAVIVVVLGIVIIYLR